jgi:hypothetical protein
MFRTIRSASCHEYAYNSRVLVSLLRRLGRDTCEAPVWAPGRGRMQPGPKMDLGQYSDVFHDLDVHPVSGTDV